LSARLFSEANRDMFLSVRPGLVRAACALAVAGTVVLTWACKDSTGQGNGCESTGATITINAQDNLTFDQPNITITKGEKVCWQNFGTLTHTVTADPNVSDSSWTLDATLAPKLVVLQTFSLVGDYSYHCTYHVASNMRGVIHVR
jgi:plastocyanin